MMPEIGAFRDSRDTPSRKRFPLRALNDVLTSQIAGSLLCNIDLTR